MPPKNDDDLDISKIYTLLYQLGITANYVGFFHTSYAVYLAARQPDRLLLVTKWLYPEVAKHYATTWKCVERNIRTVINIAWDTNPELLEKLACHSLPQKPKASKFLSILASYFSADPVAGQTKPADYEMPVIQLL